MIASPGRDDVGGDDRCNITACRSCRSSQLTPILDLGDTPVANNLIDPARADEPEPAYPLVVVLCTDCGLVQLGYALAAEAIFGADYPYLSSVSRSLVAHARRYVGQMIGARGLGPSSLVVEVASNDGYLLRHFVDAGIPVVGVDPAPAPAEVAIGRGVRTVVEFFGVRAAEAIRDEHGPASLIVANNVLAHVPDLHDVVAGMAALLADDGLVTIENPYVRDLVDHLAYDTIYHEHYCYFSCTAIDRLMAAHGLHLNDVEYFPDLHAGTLRWHVGRRSARTPRCRRLLDEETARGLGHVEFFSGFAADVARSQRELRAFLADLRAAGTRVAAYGAAAKGATLLNTAGIGTDLVAYVVDNNPNKQGKLMPGVRLPILPPSALRDDRPDALLLLAWNIAAEITASLPAFTASGGRFIHPIPKARFVP